MWLIQASFELLPDHQLVDALLHPELIHHFVVCIQKELAVDSVLTETSSKLLQRACFLQELDHSLDGIQFRQALALHHMPSEVGGDS